MNQLEMFKNIEAIIQTKENYIERNYNTIGGMWTVERWELDNVVFMVMDEGYTDRIFLKDKLDVIKKFNNDIEYKIGGKEELEKLINKYKEK